MTAQQIFAEKYELLERINSGGFGTVYRARQITLERFVALKLLNTTGLLDGEARARFDREATVLSNLRHKNIVAFYGYGIEDRTPYIAMELVDGVDLQRYISEHKNLSFTETLIIAKQVAEALGEAHNSGIVHRDLKPSNIMLQQRSLEQVKLIDFGLARIFENRDDVQRLTDTGACVGTVQFMSPEQCVGRAADHRSDIYSLGCVIYHCLTGVLPYHAENSVLVMHQHVYDELPKLVSEDRHSDAEVGAMQSVLTRCTQKEPADRYQSTSELIEDLTALLQRCQGKSTITVHPVSPTTKPVGARPRSAPRATLFAVPVALLAVALCFAAPALLPHRRPALAPIPPAVHKYEAFLESLGKGAPHSLTFSQLTEITLADPAIEGILNDYKSRGLAADPHVIAQIRLLQAKIAIRGGNLPAAQKELTEALHIHTEHRFMDKQLEEIGETLVGVYKGRDKIHSAWDAAQDLIHLYENSNPRLDTTRLKQLADELAPEKLKQPLEAKLARHIEKNRDK